MDNMKRYYFCFFPGKISSEVTIFIFGFRKRNCGFTRSSASHMPGSWRSPWDHYTTTTDVWITLFRSINNCVSHMVFMGCTQWFLGDGTRVRYWVQHHSLTNYTSRLGIHHTQAHEIKLKYPRRNVGKELFVRVCVCVLNKFKSMTSLINQTSRWLNSLQDMEHNLLKDI